MWNLLFALLILAQEPSVAELLRRLEGGDIDVREKTEIELAARGAPALAEVEAALASADSAEFRLRLKRVVRKLRLADLTSRIPRQFSEDFRAAEPALMERLKTADPGALIDAIAATTGKATHWETEDKPASHGTYKVAREITRDLVKGATRADALEVLRLAIRAIPDGDPPLEWAAVWKSTFQALKPREALDARTLFYELLRFGDRKDLYFALQSMAGVMPRADRILAYLALLDCPNADLQREGVQGLSRVEPRRHGEELVKRLEKASPEVRVQLLRCLARTGDGRFLKAVLAYAESPDKDLRWASLDSAAALDPDSVKDRILGKLKSSEDAEILQGLELVFRWKGFGRPPRPEYAREAGRIFATNKNPAVVAKALDIMMRAQGIGCAKEDILFLLSHPKVEYRKYGPSMAGQFQDAEVTKALIRTLDDPDEEVAAAAAAALALAKVPCPLERLRALAASKSPRVRHDALYALSYRLGKDGRDELAAFLEDPDPMIQMVAIDLLFPIGKGLEPRFREKLESPDASVRMAAARTLAGLGDKGSLPVLKQLLLKHSLSDTNWNHIVISMYLLVEPDCLKRLNELRLFDPGEDDTLALMLERLRAPLKEKGLDLKIDLPANILEHEMGKPAYFHPESYLFGSIVSWMGGMGWFCDGKTFFILTPKEARDRWVAWAEGK